MATITNERFGYVPELDGLRAIAVVLVIAFHALPAFPGGFVGVDIFFVLSGYLITSILLREHERDGHISFGLFYLKRALRLTPALLLMLFVFLVAIAIAWLFGKNRFVQDQSFAALMSALYVMNWVRAFNWGSAGWLGHTWSLAIEEQFYLLWPLLLTGLLVVIGRAAAWKAILGLLIAVTLWRAALIYNEASPDRIYNGFDTRADVLLFGCLIATAPMAKLLWLRRYWIIPALFLGFVVLTQSWVSEFLPKGGYTAIGLSAAWILFSCLHRSGAGPLTWWPVVQCGRISYGMYLWHFPIVCFLGSKVIGWPLFVLTMGLTIAVSATSWVLVERPILAYKNRLQPRAALA